MARVLILVSNDWLKLWPTDYLRQLGVVLISEDGSKQSE